MPDKENDHHEIHVFLVIFPVLLYRACSSAQEDLHRMQRDYPLQTFCLPEGPLPL